MKLEIEFPDAAINSAAITCWKRSFGQGDGTGSAEGLMLVRNAVFEVVQSTAVRDSIIRWAKDVVAQLGPTIVREEVKNRLRAMIKQVVKEQVEEGKLL